MKEHLAAGYNYQLDMLTKALQGEWKWPSSNAGFASYLAASSRVPLPSGCEITSLPPDRLNRMDEAPLLAAVGYAIALGSINNEDTLQSWKRGIERLHGRNAFTPDRESFLYRPFDLLGISLGVNHYNGIDETVLDWFRQTLKRAKPDLMSSGVFSSVLGAWTANILQVSWSKIHLPTLTELDDGEIGLVYWMIKLREELFTTEHPNFQSIQMEIARRFALRQASESDVARAFLIFSSLRDCVEKMVATEPILANTHAPSQHGQLKYSLPHGLTEALTKHTLTVIAGAGVSQAAAGLPGWLAALKNAIIFLEERLDETTALAAMDPLFKAGMYEEAAQVIEGLLRKINGKADFLRRQFHLEAVSIVDGELVKAIWRVAGSVVFTTNYDRIFELCGPPGIETVTWQEPDKMLASIRGQNAVVHLHGVYNDPRSVVFSAGDYIRLSENQAYQGFAHALWTRGPMLFIGMSTSGISDTDFLGLFEWGRKIVPDSPFTSYILQLRGSVTQAEKEKLYTQFKVEVVEYGDKHTDLKPFLSQLI